MRRKQGRLKPGGQYLNPTRAEEDSTDKNANTLDNRDAKATDAGTEGRCADATNKDARSLGKDRSSEKTGEDPPRDMGRKRNVKQTDSSTNKLEDDTGKKSSTIEGKESPSSKKVLTSQNPDPLPQVCFSNIQFIILAHNFLRVAYKNTQKLPFSGHLCFLWSSWGFL